MVVVMMMITLNQIRMVVIIQIIILVCTDIFVSRTDGNLQSWSVPQKKASPPVLSFSPQSFDTVVPFNPGGDDDPLCSKLLSGERLEPETQRGQVTIDILKCILKELKKRKNEDVPTTISDGGESSERESWLPRNYDKLQVPLDFSSHENLTNPVHVDFFLNIGEVMDFNEIDHFMGFDLEIIAGWKDGKIGQSSSPNNDDEHVDQDIYLSGDALDKIWRPDFFFEQIASVSHPNVGVEPKTIVLNPTTGYVKFKTRMLLNLYCDFDFFYYPADSQECHFTMRSYSYNTKLVNISWFDVGIYLHRTYDYNFEYGVVSASRNDVPERIGRWKKLDEKHATLEFVVKSRRRLSYHLVQTYIPSVLLAVVTWLCFLVPREQSEVRVGVAMTTLLTITAMFSSVRSSAPAVSYMKAIDAWMLGCIFFIFATLGGFLAIAWIQKKERIRYHQKMMTAPTFHSIVGGYDSKDIQEIPQGTHLHLPPSSEFCPVHSQFNKPTPLTGNNLGVDTASDDVGSSSLHNFGATTTTDDETCCGGGVNLDAKLDSILVTVIPSSFIVFVVTYWIWLLVASRYHLWTLSADHNNA